MALNPEIALGVRPPVLQPLEIQSPLERYGKVLTLRGMMEQQQLRGLQMQQAEQEIAKEDRAAQEAERKRQAITTFQGLFAGGQKPTPEKTWEVLGPDGTKVVSEMYDAETKRIGVDQARAARFSSRAQSILDQGTDFALRYNIEQALADGDIPQQYAQEFLKYGINDPRTQTGLISIRDRGMKAAEQLEEQRKDAEEKRKALKAPIELREATAKAKTAEDIAAGEKPIQPEERARLEAEKVRLAREEAAAKETARHNRAMEGRISQATAAGLTQSQSQRVLQIAGQFDNEPMVKNYNVIGEANNFVKSLGEKGGGNAGDDQALLYAFAKAMDPGSVVREGEYATVQRYSQSWADTFGFKAARIFSNSPFLSDDARKQMKATIEKKAASSKASYDNIYNEYGRRIERQSGVSSGKDYLTNYGQAFDGGAAPAAAGTTKVNTKEDHDKLPKGAQYVDAQDGKTYTKR